MTEAQIAATPATIARLLGHLASEALEPTSTLLTFDGGWRTVNITLHAVKAGTSSDVQIAVELDEAGNEIGWVRRDWSNANGDFYAWAPINTPAQV